MKLMKKSKPSLIWCRRDLRLQDNPALAAAVDESSQVIMVYIHAPEEETPWEPGGASRWYLHQSLLAFEQALSKEDQTLVFRVGSSLDNLLALINCTGARRVYWNRVYEPAFIKRDDRVKQALEAAGIEVKIYHDSSLLPPGQLKNAVGEQYKVFTPFWRQLSKALLDSVEDQKLHPSPAFTALDKPDRNRVMSAHTLDSLGLLDTHHWHQKLDPFWSAGEVSVMLQFEVFLDKLGNYPEKRDMLAEPGTSGLSAALHFGEISPWRLVQQLRPDWQGESGPIISNGVEAFLRQLGWREFAIQWLYNVPNSPAESIHKKYEQAGFWKTDKGLIKRWKKGRTGYKLIDAAMQELWNTGRMHNRARMVVASFLTKNLGQHWRHGARWFWDTLVDADLANNTMGWQWVAGCGCDAAPFFRIFNPERQAKQFDPDGKYIQRWTEKAQAPVDNLAFIEEPIVDLSTSRKAALDRYAALS